MLFLFLSLIALSQGSKDVFQCLPLKVSIENSLEDGNIPGLVAIVINSTNILYEEAFGYNSPPISNERQPIDSIKTIFVLASISKTFIALAVMQLVELHHLDLDNDIHLLLDQILTKKSNIMYQMMILLKQILVILFFHI